MILWIIIQICSAQSKCDIELGVNHENGFIKYCNCTLNAYIIQNL